MKATHLLVEKVPDLVNIKSAYGHTPLHTAEQNGNNDIVKYLTQKMQDLSNGN